MSIWTFYAIFATWHNKNRTGNKATLNATQFEFGHGIDKEHSSFQCHQQTKSNTLVESKCNGLKMNRRQSNTTKFVEIGVVCLD